MAIPPDAGVHGWNIPFFGGDKYSQNGSSGATTSINNVPSENGHHHSLFSTGGLNDVPPSSSTVGETLAAATAVVGGVAGTLVDPLSDPTLAPIPERIFGPMDAPHLRYIPSYFSNQIPDKLKQFFPAMISTFHQARSKIYYLLWYKPPVGIVSVWSLGRILEKMYGVWSPPAPTSGEEALADAEGKLGGIIKSLMPGSSSKFSPWGTVGRGNTADVQVAEMSLNDRLKRDKMQIRRKRRRKKYRKGRAFDLDRGDLSYENFGGVETVRVRACQEGLNAGMLIEEEEKEGATKNKSLFGSKQQTADEVDYTSDIQTAIKALQLSCPPKGSREYFVEQSANALSKLRKYVTPVEINAKGNRNIPVPSIQSQNMELLLTHSSKLIELRALDALLRTLRDRHLVVSYRLCRAQNYWKWHVNLSGGRVGRIVNKIRSEVMSMLPWADFDFRDRHQQEYERVTAACERELIWLGKVETLLLERPMEMEVSELFTVVDDTKNQGSWWSQLLAAKDEDGRIPDAEVIKSSEASFASSIQLMTQAKNRLWLRQTEIWSKNARETISASLDATVSTSFTPFDELVSHQNAEKYEGEGTFKYAEAAFLHKWASYDEDFSDTFSWLTVLSLVDYAASPQRAGEQRQFQLSGITSRIRRYDFLGIPSSALLLAAANSLHDNVIAPHSKEIVDFFKSIFAAMWGIFEFRFYTPMKDIVLDLLNKRPRMVDPFALLNEQMSLDNMLKDLGVGDGTRQTRATALAAASRMYEQEVSHGAIRGIVRGKVAQLMLIQIQQLKADLLQAMDQIDNLVDANRLNVQLVASIPAVLILIFGTRALFFAISNWRMKDLRLPKDIHAEMAGYLSSVQQVLVLANHELDATTDSNVIPARRVCLGPKEMGKVVLMLHSYLNLLDYMSPPFPSKQCDSIHQSIQNLLMQGQMSTARQLELLKVIQAKHTDLLKTL